MPILVVLVALVGLPTVKAADWWDDFSNNLATDLAPFLSLFGEQITKQYLSESITYLDYFIFATAPMGILTAVVSAIRVCGSPSLRALIGRAQEGGGSAEAELCSSTSWDVCELFNNGGIARVFGRPKILEVVYKREGLTHEPKDMETATGSMKDMFAPNLSLNVSIKKPHQLVPPAIAVVGFVLQGGVIAFAVVVTYYLKWEKEGQLPGPYAGPSFIGGTSLLWLGIYLCAFVIGQSTEERIFERHGQHSTLYWLQPGGQVLGDQTFGSFAYNDNADPLQQYTTSWKGESNRSQLAVWGVVGITLSGFIFQFVGLRGIHSAISVAQLGAILVMSAARAALRMQRLKADSNCLASCGQDVLGHELDWLALDMGKKDIDEGLGSSSSTPSNPKLTRRHYWRFSGSADGVSFKKPPTPADNGARAARNLWAYRTQLARLTASPPPHVKMSPAQNFEAEMVQVRRMARGLANAIEAVSNEVYFKATLSDSTPHAANNCHWSFKCNIRHKESPLVPKVETDYTAKSTDAILYLTLHREVHGIKEVRSLWKLDQKEAIEAILGLWIWSLKSDTDRAVGFRAVGDQVIRSSGVPISKIVSTDQDNPRQRLEQWWQDQASPPYCYAAELKGNGVRDPNAIWNVSISPGIRVLRRFSDQCDHRNACTRVFGWHNARAEDPPITSVWLTEPPSTLIESCAQEIFGSFFRDIMDIVDDMGKVDVQVVQGKCRLSNRLVSDVLQTFADSELGSRHDGLLCIAPSIVAYQIRTKRTSLMDAAESGSLEAVALLLQDGHKSGTRLNAQNIKGQTALSLAAANGNEGVVRRLLEEDGVQMDLQDLGGRTALWRAAANGHSEVVRILVNNGGADFKQPDHDGRTPIIVATDNWHDTVVRTLLVLGQRRGFRTFQRGVGLQNPEHEKKANDFFDNYENFGYSREQSLMEESRNAQRAGNLKVALLSTGLAVNRAAGQWFDGLQAWPSSKNFIDGDNTDDSDGMGTDLARLLIKTCPDIDLFIAKVTCDRMGQGLSAHIVAKAISWCAAEYGADIIIIPLGFDGPQPEIETAIKHALEGGRPPVLMAAVGHDRMRPYPASHQHIIGIHAVDGEGRDIGISPAPLEDDDNFSTLGSGIEVSWEYSTPVEHGSPYATVVAAGITTYLLDYVQQVATLTEEDRRWLRSPDGVRELLRLVSTKQHGYRFIAPWEVWGDDVKAEEIGNLVGAIVRRRKKA
ncbi:hypothetical protein BKA56DRAFT_625468 [Ilyonectria sp. MPI-CAGE-AT-0026]|nr:hypothetical protein BKA56DRAFT_625468 [Ilyonectria sp. MPI-CAGE-AT-0026]